MQILYSVDELVRWHTNHYEDNNDSLLTSTDMYAQSIIKKSTCLFLRAMDEVEERLIEEEKEYFASRIYPTYSEYRAGSIYSYGMGLAAGTCAAFCLIGTFISNSAPLKELYMKHTAGTIACFSAGFLVAGIPTTTVFQYIVQTERVLKKVKVVSKEITDMRIVRLSSKIREISDRISITHGKEQEQLKIAKDFFECKLEKGKQIQRNIEIKIKI
jgi:hypothetical protein